MQWYKSKKDVYLARTVYLFSGLSAIYFGLNEEIYGDKSFQILYIIVGILCLGGSVIAGRWSYIEDV